MNVLSASIVDGNVLSVELEYLTLYGYMPSA